MSSQIKSTTLEGFYSSEEGWFDTHETGCLGQVGDQGCRVMPSELLPEAAKGKYGRWTITVQFEPFEDVSN